MNGACAAAVCETSDTLASPQRISRRNGKPATVRWPQVTIGSYPRFLPDGPEVEVVLKSADSAALTAAVAWLEPALDDVVLKR